MLLTTRHPEDWKDLQKDVAEILRQCGFTVEIEKTIQTARGKVEIDVYAEEIVNGRKYSIICECKYWKSKIPQNVIHGFRTIVNDIGCNIGYIITTSGFQSGSINAIEYTNVELLTWDNFLRKFFESWYVTFFSPQITERLDPILTYSEPILPKWFEKLSEDDKRIYYELKDKHDVFGWLIMTFTTYNRMFNDKIPTLPLLETIKDEEYVLERIPTEILEEVGYSEFHNKCIAHGEMVTAKFRHFRDKYSDGHSDE